MNQEVAVIVDSSYTISARSVETGAVLSRTTMQLMGAIEAPDYGTISSDAVSQFMPANSLDTAGVTVDDIDALKLVMLVGNGEFVGDSLAFMGMEVYPLTKQLTTPIYSNFNPEGYYDSSRLLGSTVYNLTHAAEPDSIKNMHNSFYTLSVDLPREMGQQLFTDYVNNPTLFSSPTEFAKYFPGLYLKNSYGSGRITRIASTTMQMMYHKNAVNDAGRDTTYYKTGTYFAVTPEIIANNDIELEIAPEIRSKVADGDVVMLAPAGLDVELTFPAREIISTYRAGTTEGLAIVNNISFVIPVEQIENKYDILPPETVLLVLSKQRESFFLENKLPDNITSFQTTRSPQSDGSSAYVFPDMRDYILSLMDKDEITDDDVTFSLVPVTLTTEANNDYYGNVNSTLTAVVPYVIEPKMVKILTEKVKIKFVYTLQTTNF